MSNSDLRPSRAIFWHIVNLNQKWRGNEQRAVRGEHLEYIAYRAIRPKQMLEHLLGDNDVELIIMHAGADVVSRKIYGTIATKPMISPFFATEFPALRNAPNLAPE